MCLCIYLFAYMYINRFVYIHVCTYPYTQYICICGFKHVTWLFSTKKKKQEKRKVSSTRLKWCRGMLTLWLRVSTLARYFSSLAVFLFWYLVFVFCSWEHSGSACQHSRQICIYITYLYFIYIFRGVYICKYRVAITHRIPYKLQDIFCKRATIYRALLQKMTCKDKASYVSWPPCSAHDSRYM